MLKKIDYSNSFGIQIEDNALRLLELKKTGKGLKVKGFFKKSLDFGTVEKGVVKKEKTLAKIIEKTRLDCTPNPIKVKKVICSIPEYKSFVKIVEVPFMKEEEAAEAIKWETESNIPLPLAKVYYDWKIIESFQEEGKMKVLLVAASKDIIDSRVKALERCGLIPVGFIPDSFGLNKCFATENYSPEGRNTGNVQAKQKDTKEQLLEASQSGVIIYFGDEKSVVFARKNSTILFSSSILFNASEFVKNIVGTLVPKDPKNPNAPNSVEEDAILEKIGEKGFGLKNREEKYCQAAQAVIQELLREVKNALNYLERREGMEAPSVYLTGAGASLKGIENLLSEELGIKVEKGKELLGYNLEGEKLAIPKNFICDYSIVLGNALG